MSPLGVTHPVIIETRRTARAKAESSQNDKLINKLNPDLGSGDRGDDSARDTSRFPSLYRSGAERDVPFRHSIKAPQLNAAFVAQLLGQAMAHSCPRSSGTLAAYEQPGASALFCDRRL